MFSDCVFHYIINSYSCYQPWQFYNISSLSVLCLFLDCSPQASFLLFTFILAVSVNFTVLYYMSFLISFISKHLQWFMWWVWLEPTVVIIKAAVWSLEKKVDLARRFEWYRSQVPPSSSMLRCSMSSKSLLTEEPAVHEQACNDGNKRTPDNQGVLKKKTTTSALIVLFLTNTTKLQWWVPHADHCIYPE